MFPSIRHAPHEVPFDTESDIKEDIFYGTEKELIIKVIDMVNDASIQDASISNRKCRFPWERNTDGSYPMLYDQYSYSTCFIECSMEIQLELCNCTHHLMPKFLNAANTCDIDGLICLTNNFGEMSFFLYCILPILSLLIIFHHLLHNCLFSGGKFYTEISATM